MVRRTASGLIFTRGGNILACREGKFDDRNMHLCSRSRCSASLHSIQASQVTDTKRAKQMKVSNSGSLLKTSSTGNIRMSHSNQCFPGQQTRSSTRGTTIVESSARQGGTKQLYCNTKVTGDNLDCSSRSKKKVSESMLRCPSIQTVLAEHGEVESKDLQDFSDEKSERSKNCSTGMVLRACKQVMKEPRSSKQGCTGSSTSKIAKLAECTSQSVGSGHKNEFRNLKCSVSSDVPSGLSSADSGSSKRINAGRKVSSTGERLLSRGKSTMVSRTQVIAGLNSTSPHGPTLQQASRRPRNQPPDLPMLHTRTSQVPEVKMRMRQRERTHNSISLSNQMVTAAPTANATQPTQVPWMERDDSWNSNMEGVADAPWPTIEELTNEQEVESQDYYSSDSSGSSDQYGDMRMDIDSMSYEELLALGEKIGNVSTALTEEALSKCLHKSNYEPACLASVLTGQEEEDVQCSICQEEYLLGEELGKLVCSHRYHVTCILEWFQLKDWCPICKASMSSTI